MVQALVHFSLPGSEHAHRSSCATVAPGSASLWCASVFVLARVRLPRAVALQVCPHGAFYPNAGTCALAECSGIASVPARCLFPPNTDKSIASVSFSVILRTEVDLIMGLGRS